MDLGKKETQATQN